MNIDWRPWRQMLPMWLPVVIFALVLAGWFFYQTSDSVGRKATLASDIVRFGADVERLEILHEAVVSDRQEVEELQVGFQDINDRVFSDLDLRLTRILRATGNATRESGLLPGTYSYSAKEERKLGYVRFGIGFQVVGEYAQIRKMLALLQASPEFLIVDGLSLDKDDDQASRSLKIGVRLSTYLGQVDPDRLRRLTGGIVETESELSDG